MILCCGEALIDLLPADATGARTGLVGGSVLNTAVALGRLGAPVGLMTGLSNDNYGQMIEAFLRDSNVDTTLSVRSDRPTTIADVTLVDGQAVYDFRDEGSALREITASDLPALPKGVCGMVFGGISLIHPPVADALHDYCQRYGRDAVSLLDINVRPNFITNPKAYRERIADMIAFARVVKVSDDDVAWLYPGTARPEVALLEAGCDAVLMTKGAEGARLTLASGLTLETPATPAKVVDTVGAGDTFNAGFLSALHRQNALSPKGFDTASSAVLQSALDFAVRVAAITVSRAGADAPWAHELEGNAT